MGEQRRSRPLFFEEEKEEEEEIIIIIIALLALYNVVGMFSRW